MCRGEGGLRAVALVLHNDLTRFAGDQLTGFQASPTCIWAPQSLLLLICCGTKTQWTWTYHVCLFVSCEKKKKKKSTFRRSWRALNVCRWRVPTNHAPICLEKREVVPPLSPRACWVTPPKEGFIKKMSHYSLQSGSALRKRGCETLMKKRNALDHWLKPYGVSKFTTNNITLILCVVSAILLVCYQWDNSKLSSLFLAKSRIKNKHISSKGK